MNAIFGISVWSVAKFFVVFFLGMYVVFSLVIIKQIRLMLDTVEIGLAWLIKFVGWAHLLFAIGVFILGVIIL